MKNIAIMIKLMNIEIITYSYEKHSQYETDEHLIMKSEVMKNISIMMKLMNIEMMKPKVMKNIASMKLMNIE